MITGFVKRQRDRVIASAPRLCVVHVPKCGGSSVRRALLTGAYTPLQRATGKFFMLNAAAGEAATTLDDRPFPEIAMSLASYHLMKRDYIYVHGHFHCTPKMINGAPSDWKFVTILRNPVNRFLSAYTFDRYRDRGPFTTTVEIDEFLETQRAFYEGRIYLYHFSSFSRRNDNSPHVIAECQREALETLGKVHVVGTVENTDAWLRRFEDVVGRRLAFARVNQNPRPDVAAKLRADRRIMSKIEQLCAADMEIYESCLARATS